MPVVQDFPVPAGDAMDVTFTLDPSDGISLEGATVIWQAYAAEFGVPLPSPILISKSSNEEGEFGPQIDILPSPADQFVVHLYETDTGLPPGNYYHEAEIIDASENHATVCQGTMTITLTLIA